MLVCDLIVFDWSGTLSPLDSYPKDTLYPEVKKTLETLRKQGVISVPSSSSNYNQQQSSLKFLSPQLTEGLVIAIFCALGTSLSAFLLALVPTLRAAANATTPIVITTTISRSFLEFYTCLAQFCHTLSGEE